MCPRICRTSVGVKQLLAELNPARPRHYPPARSFPREWGPRGLHGPAGPATLCAPPAVGATLRPKQTPLPGDVGSRASQTRVLEPRIGERPGNSWPIGWRNWNDGVLRLANDAASGGLRRAGYESFGIHAPEAPLMHGSTHLGLTASTGACSPSPASSTTSGSATPRGATDRAGSGAAAASSPSAWARGRPHRSAPVSYGRC